MYAAEKAVVVVEEVVADEVVRSDPNRTLSGCRRWPPRWPG